MIKEKITALVKKDEKNNKKKIENLVFAFVLLVITLITINIIFKGDKKKEKTNVIGIETKQVSSDTTVDMEQKLEDILIRIKGVDEVKVLITYSETEKLVPIYNESSSQSTTEEKDVCVCQPR